MESIAKSTYKENVRFFVIRIVLAMVIFFVYFIAWRPARIAITEKIIYPQLLQLQNHTIRMQWKNNSILIYYRYDDVFKQLQYRFGMGFFFLVALILLLFFTQKATFYVILFAINITATLVAYIGLVSGVSGAPIGFIATDIINAYLVPALSLIIIPLATRDFKLASTGN